MIDAMIMATSGTRSDDIFSGGMRIVYKICNQVEEPCLKNGGAAPQWSTTDSAGDNCDPPIATYESLEATGPLC